MRKQQRLEDLYASHDLKSLEISSLIQTKDKKDMTEEEQKALQLQQDAQKELIDKLK